MLTLPLCGSRLGGGNVAYKLNKISNTTMQQVSEFFATLFSVLHNVCDAIDDSQDKLRIKLRKLKKYLLWI